MNTKKIVLAIIAVVFLSGNIFTAVAQDTEVTTKWGANFVPNVKNSLHTYLGEDENSYYLLTDATVVYTLEKYNKETFEHEASKPLNRRGIKSIFSLGGETYFYGYEYEKDQEKGNGFYRFEKSKMAFEFVAGQIEGVSFDKLDSRRTSPDESKILFAFKGSYNKKEKTRDYQLLVIDDRLKTLWKKKITIPYISDFTVDFTIDNEGNVYTASREWHKDRKKKDKTAYNYVVMKSSADKEKRFVVNMNGYFYHKCKMLTDKNNNLLVVGFYTDRANEKNTGGYYFSMNNSFDAAENISYQQMELFYGKKKKLHERYDDYNFGRPLYGENGDIAICSELNIIVTYESASTSTSASKTTKYLFLDVYVFKITEGELAWMKRVPKYEFSDGYSAFLSGDNVTLIFWDHKENMNVDEYSEKVQSVQKPLFCQLVGVTLNKNGEQAKKIIETNGLDKDLYPFLIYGKHISNNCAIFPATRVGFGSLSMKSKIGVICVE